MLDKIMSKINALPEAVDLLFAYHYPGVDCVLTATSGRVTLFKVEMSTDEAVSLMVELTKNSQKSQNPGGV